MTCCAYLTNPVITSYNEFCYHTKVAMDENKQSKGFGFVHFDKQESADLAIDKVNGKLLNEMKV